MVNEAALFAARQDRRTVSKQQFEDAKDKIMMGAERRSLLISNEEKETTAYHEVGHAIIGTLVKDHDPVQKVTLIPRGQAKGLTWFSPDDDQMLISRTQLKARIMGALGGRAAEDVVFGREEVTVKGKTYTFIGENHLICVE